MPIHTLFFQETFKILNVYVFVLAKYKYKYVPPQRGKFTIYCPIEPPVSARGVPSFIIVCCSSINGVKPRHFCTYFGRFYCLAVRSNNISTAAVDSFARWVEDISRGKFFFRIPPGRENFCFVCMYI